ncbi:M23 family metallopeptidase [Kitasatospora phosalacinea]|uniref:M23 family metallopeptidase n=1 Tax=Kitasatospora phosalacinea TaxID=2065 RepID=UPI000A5960EA|nr:M23 family metallopeptidase [Kitasatospora phosalacinea]
MRSLPATGRRLLQATTTRHVRSVLSGGPLTTARLAPAKAIASGAAVVAAGALLIPTGQAVAQGSHPADRAVVTATAESGAAQPKDFHLPAQGDQHDEQAENTKAAILATLQKDADQGAQARQDDAASRDEHRIDLGAAAQTGDTAGQQQGTEQQQAATEQPAAQPAPAEQPTAPAEQPAEQPAAPAAQPAAPAEQPQAAPAAAPEPKPEPAPEPAKPSWSSPAPGATISNPYHKTNAAYAAGYHTGTDFAVSVGTPVLAVGDATVVSSGYAGAYGNQIVLKLSDGRFAQYAHLSQLGVKAGQHVGAGDRVGKSGNTGNSHGPHLHFEIRTANQYAKVIDPVGYLKQHGANNF